MGFVKVEIRGAEELKARLEELSKRKMKNIARGYVTAAAAFLRDEIRSATPVDTGLLQRAIRAKRNRGEADVARASVFVSMKQRKPRKDGTSRVAKNGKEIAPFYWRFIEYGTRFRPARPFMRPTFQTRAEAAIDVAAAYARRRLAEEA